MATLTITVKEMFLYVRRTTAPDVILLPSGAGGREHRTRIAGLGVDEELKRADVSFGGWSNRQFHRIAGAAQRTSSFGGRLVDLPDVLGDVHVPRELLEDALPATVNARITVPNGGTTAYPARNSKARSVRWDFTDSRRVVLPAVELTDIIQTVIPVPPNEALYILIESLDGPPLLKQLATDASGNYYVTIRNEDTRCGSNDDVPDKEYTLDEYRLLYALTNTRETDLALPVGTYGTPGVIVPLSDCLPICGGAGCPGPPGS